MTGGGVRTVTYVPPYILSSSSLMFTQSLYFSFFFFNDTATTEIYTLSLHDALPIYLPAAYLCVATVYEAQRMPVDSQLVADRKSTRLNSSHSQISYAVFCLKKKKKRNTNYTHTTATREQKYTGSYLCMAQCGSVHHR